MEAGKVLDGVVAQDATQFANLWSLREFIPEACSKTGAAYKYDLSIPVGEMYSVVEEMREHLRAKGLLKGDGAVGDPIRGVAGFGHMGDGGSTGMTVPLT
jgi:FAD/FMN-containing dehydrogenase